MSIIKFEIKDDHLKLVPFLKFKTEGRSILSGDEAQSPFGGEDLYEEMGRMIYGKPDADFDPFATEEPQYSTEQKKYLESLFQDLPTVLEIILKSGNFKPGEYKRKAHDENVQWHLTNKN